MMQIQNVLCPVDFSPLCERELDLAIEICETFGARLILHHNLEFAPPGVSKTWEWEETHRQTRRTEAEAEKLMQALLDRIPKSVPAEGTISRGLVLGMLLHLVEKVPIDLVILGTHGWSTEEHASVAERLLADCPCPVLTLRDNTPGNRPLRLRGEPGEPLRVLVSTDFSPTAEAAVAYAYDLARVIPMELHLLHVVPSDQPPQMLPLDHLTEGTVEKGSASEAARRKLTAAVPADLAARVHGHVEVGLPASEVMVAMAERLDPHLLVMGRHARGFFKHFFTRDTSREMLHRASCPVWFAA